MSRRRIRGDQELFAIAQPAMILVPRDLGGIGISARRKRGEAAESRRKLGSPFLGGTC
jgi:hypothetical protein